MKTTLIFFLLSNKNCFVDFTKNSWIRSQPCLIRTMSPGSEISSPIQFKLFSKQCMCVCAGGSLIPFSTKSSNVFKKSTECVLHSLQIFAVETNRTTFEIINFIRFSCWFTKECKSENKWQFNFFDAFSHINFVQGTTPKKIKCLFLCDYVSCDFFLSWALCKIQIKLSCWVQCPLQQGEFTDVWLYIIYLKVSVFVLKLLFGSRSVWIYFISGSQNHGKFAIFFNAHK